MPPETFSRRATHRFPPLFPFSNNVPKCHALVVLLWKKDTRYKNYFTFINFGFLSSTWRHFAALLENGNKGANRWLVPLETILGDIFFSLQSLKCLLKSRQKHSQEEPVIEFRLCFRFLMRHIVEKVMQTFGQLGGNVFKTFVCSKWRSLFCPPGTRK